MQILGLIKDILPHIAALNQLNYSKDQNGQMHLFTLPRLRDNSEPYRKKCETEDNSLVAAGSEWGSTNDITTTSNHYCIVESEHPYRSASINCYRVEFPACVQWLTIEFDAQCGTAQLEDYLLVSMPTRPLLNCEPGPTHDDYYDILDNNIKTNRGNCKNATLIATCYKAPAWRDIQPTIDPDWIVVKKFNT